MWVKRDSERCSASCLLSSQSTCSISAVAISTLCFDVHLLAAILYSLMSHLLCHLNLLFQSSHIRYVRVCVQCSNFWMALFQGEKRSFSGPLLEQLPTDMFHLLLGGSSSQPLIFHCCIPRMPHHSMPSSTCLSHATRKLNALPSPPCLSRTLESAFSAQGSFYSCLLAVHIVWRTYLPQWLSLGTLCWGIISNK